MMIMTLENHSPLTVDKTYFFSSVKYICDR